ncbi:MAG: hypothetical protein EBU10_01630 [Alphaproteobacteria bacterium]|nr:hypothetical protein [Alphaproteobacteria bacterium]
MALRMHVIKPSEVIMVTFIQETSTNSIAHTSHNVDTEWLQYFSLKKALITVADHVAQLPSSSTPEKHTWKVYQSGLKYFLNYTSGARLTGQAYDDADIQQIASLIMAHGAYLPSKEVVMRYIAHLKTEQGISARTIASRYLAPMRHYLDALIDQHIRVTGEARDLGLPQCRVPGWGVIFGHS